MWRQADTRQAAANSKAQVKRQMPRSKREASEVKEVKTNKIATKLKTALEPEMRTVSKQKVEGSKPHQRIEEEMKKKLPVKNERNEEEIQSPPVQNDHSSTCGDETEEPETPVQETLPIEGSVKWENK